ncbi:MAG: DUF2520 domain-containing protein [Bacteroidales bacterium]|nr:DUF2520 domain-containing protein [Bacteroidales bacterium]
MRAIQTVVIVGSGNVASHLAFAFKEVGIQLLGIYSRHYENAQELAAKTGVKAIRNLQEIPLDADAYLYAVNDVVLPEVLKNSPDIEGLMMHTSGTVGLDVFPDRFKRTAVFYPLQTFTKDKEVDFSAIPILIESKNKADLKLIDALGRNLSTSIRITNSEQRKQIHLAAVFACNFSNYMFYIAQDLLQEKGLDFNLLKPLINETVDKINTLSPAESQTGPAKRKDFATLNKHLEMLKHNPVYLNIYHSISEQIQKINSK